MNLREAEGILWLDCSDKECTEAGRQVLSALESARLELANMGAERVLREGEHAAELRELQTRARALLDAVESPRRGIYVDECRALRELLGKSYSKPG